MYDVYHGSWRDFGTAVGAFSIRVLFASLTRHTLRLWALTRPSAQPTVPGHGEQASNPGFALMMFVTHVVIGHG